MDNWSTTSKQLIESEYLNIKTGISTFWKYRKVFYVILFSVCTLIIFLSWRNNFFGFSIIELFDKDEIVFNQNIIHLFALLQYYLITIFLVVYSLVFLLLIWFTFRLTKLFVDFCLQSFPFLRLQSDFLKSSAIQNREFSTKNGKPLYSVVFIILILGFFLIVYDFYKTTGISTSIIDSLLFLMIPGIVFLLVVYYRLIYNFYKSSTNKVQVKQSFFSNMNFRAKILFTLSILIFVLLFKYVFFDLYISPIPIGWAWITSWFDNQISTYITKGFNVQGVYDTVYIQTFIADFKDKYSLIGFDIILDLNSDISIITNYLSNRIIQLYLIAASFDAVGLAIIIAIIFPESRKVIISDISKTIGYSVFILILTILSLFIIEPTNIDWKIIINIPFFIGLLLSMIIALDGSSLDKVLKIKHKINNTT